MRIIFFNQIDFPLTRPMLHCFLALDRQMNVAKTFKPDQTMNAILFAEAFEYTLLVLPRTPDDV